MVLEPLNTFEVFLLHRNEQSKSDAPRIVLLWQDVAKAHHRNRSAISTAGAIPRRLKGIVRKSVVHTMQDAFA